MEGFLNVARAQNGQLDEHHQVALEPLIAAALEARANEIATKSLAVDRRLIEVRTAGSATLLARMIENVIENAVRHTQPEGSITVTLAQLTGQRARMTLDSSGPVLDPGDVAELAQPFKRLGRDRVGSQNGHGLGLSIAATIAAAHGGSLALGARAEGGLRVQITLPATAVPERLEAGR